MKITELEIMLETISQPQPGMGPLPDIWEDKAIPRTSTEQQAKVDALGEKIWNHNFGPDAKRRP
jgi:hypothetical protein